MLMDIMIVLVVISLVLCSVVYLHLAHITSVVEALSFTVVLMVASIPLAIEIVTTTTLALGSKELSHHGAIVTRLSAIEDMAGMAILCSDKTGTMTLNKMQLQPEAPIYCKGESQYSLLRYALFKMCIQLFGLMLCSAYPYTALFHATYFFITFILNL